MMTAIQNRAHPGMNNGPTRQPITTQVTKTPGPGQPLAAQEDFITKEEVARRLKKTSRTIENWQRRGYIPFVKAGHSVLYKWSDVEAHLQHNFRICHLPD